MCTKSTLVEHIYYLDEAVFVTADWSAQVAQPMLFKWTGQSRQQ